MSINFRALGAAAVVALSGGMAWGDSISPETFSATLAVGESVTIKKTVTVDAGTLTTGKVDVMFLFDTSGSMGSTIDAAKANAAAILSQTSGFGDVAWGVASYEDFPRSPWGGSGDLPWRLNQAVTTNTTDVTSGLNSLALGWGNDGPESNLHALKESVENAGTGWRTDSTKFIVWFGDAPGHDPVSCATQGIAGCTNPATAGYPGPTLTQTIAALTGQDITVVGVSSNSGGYAGGINNTGQAAAITSATGGLLTSLGAADDIADLIEGAISDTFATYSSVWLDAVGNLPGVDVEISPGYVGDFDREETRTFDFEVKFTALEAGTHSFAINAMVDKNIVAVERDKITVPGGPAPVPLPAAGWLMIAGLGGLAALRRRRKA